MIAYRGGLWGLGQAVAPDAEHTEAHVNRGNVRLELGDHRGAVADYASAVSRPLNPEQAVVHRGRGDAHAHRGEYDHAVRDCSAAFRLDPENATARRGAGDVHYHGDVHCHNERYAGALRHYGRAFDG